MQPVSVARGTSWLPAIIAIFALGSSVRRRESCRKASRIAGLVGRTLWKTSPAMTTTSGASSMTLSIAFLNARDTSASRWLKPAGVSR
jgi:hypothetical protein